MNSQNPNSIAPGGLAVLVLTAPFKVPNVESALRTGTITQNTENPPKLKKQPKTGIQILWKSKRWSFLHKNYFLD